MTTKERGEVAVQTIVVIGLGYVGLPLVEAACGTYPRVLGFDIDQGVVDSLNRGESHVEDITDHQVVGMLRQGFEATTSTEDIAGGDVYVICVPTPLAAGGGPDLTAVRAASRTVMETMRPGALVVLESTTYPGTTEDIVRPILEASGMLAARILTLRFRRRGRPRQQVLRHRQHAQDRGWCHIGASLPG